MFSISKSVSNNTSMENIKGQLRTLKFYETMILGLYTSMPYLSLLYSFYSNISFHWYIKINA
jgi:hypothetical protein